MLPLMSSCFLATVVTRLLGFDVFATAWNETRSLGGSMVSVCDGITQ